MTEPIGVSAEVAAKYPDVRVYRAATAVAEPAAVQAAAEKQWAAQHERWFGVSRGEIRRSPNVSAYRAFSSRLGLDPDRQPPSVQALVERGLRTKPLGGWPHINPVVDLLNATAVTTMVALGVFDADRLSGPVHLRFTRTAEQVHLLGMDGPEELAAGRLVLADDERVLSLFGYRDGVHQAVTLTTRNVLVLGCLVDGITDREVSSAVDLAVAGLHKG